MGVCLKFIVMCCGSHPKLPCVLLGDRVFDNARPGNKAVLHLVSVRSHTTRTPRGLGQPDLVFVLDSLAGPSERTMAQSGAFKDRSNASGDCAAPRAHPRAWAGRAVLSGVRRL